MREEITFLIQARLGSTRLPRKVLLRLYKKSLLENICDRIPSSNIIVLTSDSPLDDDLENFCIAKSIDVRRGSEANVFDRFLDVVNELQTPYFARITGDNPFVEISNYGDMLDQMRHEKLDRILNVNVPLGCSFEILTKESFLKQSTGVIDSFQKEHVTSAYYQNQDVYRCGVYRHKFKELSKLRLTIDEPLDLELARAICNHFSKEASDISIKDIQSLYEDNPQVFQLNIEVKQNTK